MQLMQHFSNQSVAAFQANPQYPRNDDVDYPYRQDSNFYYLTGLQEKEARLLLIPRGLKIDGYSEKIHEILFVMARDSAKEIWNGLRLGTEGAKAKLNFEVVFTNDRFDDYFKQALVKVDTLFTNTFQDRHNKTELNKADTILKNITNVMIASPDKMLTRMREIKSIEELKLLEQAIEITCEAMREVIRSARIGMHEYELQGIIEYIFKKNGSERLGFPTIVGSGPHSCILHYHAGNRIVNDGDMVVMDIGAEYNMYTADVTRTIPINGKFSKEQTEIYNLVLKAQEASIKIVEPGIMFSELKKKAVEVIVEGLIELEFLEGSSSENIENGMYKDFFMHGVSHYLGLDVHDAGTYKELKSGNVITVEPGIYISEAVVAKYGLHSNYANIGVRIEDDILVTKTGHKNLSIDVPRSIHEIEILMTEDGTFK